MIKISRGVTCLPYALHIITLSTLLFALRLISMDHFCGSVAFWFSVVWPVRSSERPSDRKRRVGVGCYSFGSLPLESQ